MVSIWRLVKALVVVQDVDDDAEVVEEPLGGGVSGTVGYGLSVYAVVVVEDSEVVFEEVGWLSAVELADDEVLDVN